MAFGRRNKAAATTAPRTVNEKNNVGTNGRRRGMMRSIQADIESAFIEFIGTFVFLLFALGGSSLTIESRRA